MFSRVRTATLHGLAGKTVFVETDLSQGLPALSVVGLPDLSVREARERIRSAILNSGFRFPAQRITINLSPAGERKEGTHFDLPIAMGVLAACGTVSAERISEYAFLGELSLEGRLTPVRGALPLCIRLRRDGVVKIILPKANLPEAELLPGVELFPAEALRELVDWFSHEGPPKGIPGGREPWPLSACGAAGGDDVSEAGAADFADVLGHEGSKRMLQVGAAGLHGVLMSGPAGCGKTMLARRIPSILPNLTQEERLEVAQIYSVAGLAREKWTGMGRRPFRAPHHTITAPAMAGGGRRPTPGEVSLAHCGVLFLDELPEFQREVLELLRQPLEDKQVLICRSEGNVAFPADFMLVGAMNPCPCGHFGEADPPCTCTETQIRRYRSRVSGPLLDRIDLLIEVPPVPYDKLLGACFWAGERGIDSAELREGVELAWRAQQKRFQGTRVHFNSQMNSTQIRRYCVLNPDCQHLLELACSKWRLSARGVRKVLRLARTIADLAGSEAIDSRHLAEAIRCRCPENGPGRETF